MVICNRKMLTIGTFGSYMVQKEKIHVTDIYTRIETNLIDYQFNVQTSATCMFDIAGNLIRAINSLRKQSARMRRFEVDRPSLYTGGDEKLRQPTRISVKRSNMANIS